MADKFKNLLDSGTGNAQAAAQAAATAVSKSSASFTPSASLQESAKKAAQSTPSFLPSAELQSIYGGSRASTQSQSPFGGVGQPIPSAEDIAAENAAKQQKQETTTPEPLKEEGHDSYATGSDAKYDINEMDVTDINIGKNRKDTAFQANYETGWGADSDRNSKSQKVFEGHEEKDEEGNTYYVSGKYDWMNSNITYTNMVSEFIKDGQFHTEEEVNSYEQISANLYYDYKSMAERFGTDIDNMKSVLDMGRCNDETIQYEWSQYQRVFGSKAAKEWQKHIAAAEKDKTYAEQLRDQSRSQYDTLKTMNAYLSGFDDDKKIVEGSDAWNAYFKKTGGRNAAAIQEEMDMIEAALARDRYASDATANELPNLAYATTVEDERATRKAAGLLEDDKRNAYINKLNILEEEQKTALGIEKIINDKNRRIDVEKNYFLYSDPKTNWVKKEADLKKALEMTTDPEQVNAINDQLWFVQQINDGDTSKKYYDSWSSKDINAIEDRIFALTYDKKETPTQTQGTTQATDTAGRKAELEKKSSALLDEYMDPKKTRTAAEIIKEKKAVDAELEALNTQPEATQEETAVEDKLELPTEHERTPQEELELNALYQLLREKKQEEMTKKWQEYSGKTYDDGRTAADHWIEDAQAKYDAVLTASSASVENYINQIQTALDKNTVNDSKDALRVIDDWSETEGLTDAEKTIIEDIKQYVDGNGNFQRDKASEYLKELNQKAAMGRQSAREELAMAQSKKAEEITHNADYEDMVAKGRTALPANYADAIAEAQNSLDATGYDPTGEVPQRILIDSGLFTDDAEGRKEAAEFVKYLATLPKDAFTIKEDGSGWSEGSLFQTMLSDVFGIKSASELYGYGIEKALFSEQQKDAFYYLYAKEGPIAAFKYAIGVNNNINAEYQDKLHRNYLEVAEYMADNMNPLDAIVNTIATPFLTSLESMTGLADAIKYADQLATFGATYSGGDPTLSEFSQWQDESAILGLEHGLKLDQKYYKAAEFLYGVYRSSVQSFEVMGLGSTLASLAGLTDAISVTLPTLSGVQTMGAKEAFAMAFSDITFFGSAFADTYRNLESAGVDPMQASKVALYSGLFEAGFEHWSLDNLYNAKNVSNWGSTFGQRLLEGTKETLIQAGIEGSEELFTDIANFISEEVLLDYQSDYQKTIANYMDQYRLTEEQAIKFANHDLAMQLATSFFAGAASGGFSGAVQITRGANAEFSKSTKEYREAIGKKYTDISSNGQTAAQKVAEFINGYEFVKPGDEGKLNESQEDLIAGMKGLAEKVLKGNATDEDVGRMISYADQYDMDLINDLAMANKDFFIVVQPMRVLQAASQAQEKLLGAEEAARYDVIRRANPDSHVANDFEMGLHKALGEAYNMDDANRIAAFVEQVITGNKAITADAIHEAFESKEFSNPAVQQFLFEYLNDRIAQAQTQARGNVIPTAEEAAKVGQESPIFTSIDLYKTTTPEAQKKILETALTDVWTKAKDAKYNLELGWSALFHHELNEMARQLREDQEAEKAEIINNLDVAGIIGADNRDDNDTLTEDGVTVTRKEYLEKSLKGINPFTGGQEIGTPPTAEEINNKFDSKLVQYVASEMDNVGGKMVKLDLKSKIDEAAKTTATKDNGKTVIPPAEQSREELQKDEAARAEAIKNAEAAPKNANAAATPVETETPKSEGVENAAAKAATTPVETKATEENVVEEASEEIQEAQAEVQAEPAAEQPAAEQPAKEITAEERMVQILDEISNLRNNNGDDSAIKALENEFNQLRGQESKLPEKPTITEAKTSGEDRAEKNAPEVKHSLEDGTTTSSITEADTEDAATLDESYANGGTEAEAFEAIEAEPEAEPETVLSEEKEEPAPTSAPSIKPYTTTEVRQMDIRDTRNPDADTSNRKWDDKVTIDGKEISRDEYVARLMSGMDGITGEPKGGFMFVAEANDIFDSLMEAKESTDFVEAVDQAVKETPATAQTAAAGTPVGAASKAEPSGVTPQQLATAAADVVAADRAVRNETDPNKRAELRKTLKEKQTTYEGLLSNHTTDIGAAIQASQTLLNNRLAYLTNQRKRVQNQIKAGSRTSANIRGLMAQDSALKEEISRTRSSVKALDKAIESYNKASANLQSVRNNMYVEDSKAAPSQKTGKTKGAKKNGRNNTSGTGSSQRTNDVGQSGWSGPSVTTVSGTVGETGAAAEVGSTETEQPSEAIVLEGVTLLNGEVVLDTDTLTPEDIQKLEGLNDEEKAIVLQMLRNGVGRLIIVNGVLTNGKIDPRTGGLQMVRGNKEIAEDGSETIVINKASASQTAATIMKHEYVHHMLSMMGAGQRRHFVNLAMEIIFSHNEQLYDEVMEVYKPGYAVAYGFVDEEGNIKDESGLIDAVHEEVLSDFYAGIFNYGGSESVTDTLYEFKKYMNNAVRQYFERSGLENYSEDMWKGKKHIPKGHMDVGDFSSTTGFAFNRTYQESKQTSAGTARNSLESLTKGTNLEVMYTVPDVEGVTTFTDWFKSVSTKDENMTLEEAQQIFREYVRTGKATVVGVGKRGKDNTVTKVDKVTAQDIINSPLARLVVAAKINGSIDNKEMKRQFDFIAETVDLINHYKDADLVWEVLGSEMFAAIKANSDPQYGRTIDFSTICKKTQATIDAIGKTMEKLGSGLSKEEIKFVYQQVGLAGESTPCPVCYVFSRWMGLGSILDNVNTFQKKYGIGKDKELLGMVERVYAATTAKTEEESLTFGKAINKAQGDVDKQIKDAMSSLMLLPEAMEKAGPLRAQIADWEAKYDTLSKTKKKQLVTLHNKLNAYDAALARTEEGWIAEIDRLNELSDEFDAYKWAVYARVKENEDAPGTFTLRDDFKPVPPEVLFNLNRGEEFAKNYPGTWAYRTTRGSGLGKAILPYSDARVGETIQGVAKDISDIKIGEANPFMDPSKMTAEAKEILDKARKKMASQNLIGGMRYQSTSDFRYEYASDYLLTFFEMQAMGANVQLYTKVIEAVDFFANVGCDVNLSVMPMGKGLDVLKEQPKDWDTNYDRYYSYENGKYTKLQKGEAVPEFVPGKYHEIVYSDVTGVNGAAARTMVQKYDNVQMIMVGINADHINACLDSDDITFVIPFHGSGNSRRDIQQLMNLLHEDISIKKITDFDDYENDHELTASNPARDLRKKIVTGGFLKKGKRTALNQKEYNILKGNPFLLNLFRRFYLDTMTDGVLDRVQIEQNYQAEDLQGLDFGDAEEFYKKYYLNGVNECYHTFPPGGDTAEKIFPYEYWDKSLKQSEAKANGDAFIEYCKSIGLQPRFSGRTKEGAYDQSVDFTSNPNYWKLLIDRKMYDNNGNYRAQRKIDLSRVANDNTAAYNFAQQATPGYGEVTFGAGSELANEANNGESVMSKINDPSKTNAIAEKAAAAILEARAKNQDKYARFAANEDIQQAMEAADPKLAAIMLLNDTGVVNDNGELVEAPQSKHSIDMLETSVLERYAQEDLIDLSTWNFDEHPRLHPDLKLRMQKALSLNRALITYFEDLDENNPLRYTEDEINDLMAFNLFNGNIDGDDMPRASELVYALSDISKEQKGWRREQTYQLMNDLIPHLSIAEADRWTEKSTYNQPANEDFYEWYIDRNPVNEVKYRRSPKVNDRQKNQEKREEVKSWEDPDEIEKLYRTYKRGFITYEEFLEQAKEVNTRRATEAMQSNEMFRQFSLDGVDVYDNRATEQFTNFNGDQVTVGKFSLDPNGITSITYFAGSGTLDYALRDRLFHMFAVEYDPDIRDMYIKNNGNSVMITDADVNEVRPGTVLAGHVDYFHASPVCKNFSMANNKSGETDLDRSFADSIVKGIRAWMPKVFTLENVKGYLGSDSLKIVTDTLDELGYKWDVDVYRASDYGAATIRDRLFVRAVKDGELPAKPTKTAATSWWDAVSDLVDELPTMTYEEGIAPYRRERLARMGIDLNNLDQPILLLSGTKGGEIQIAKADQPSPTLMTKGEEARIVLTDGTIKKVTPRVYARIQGLDDEFILPTQKRNPDKIHQTNAFKILGNGVPTQLTQAIVNPLLDTIDKNGRYSLEQGINEEEMSDYFSEIYGPEWSEDFDGAVFNAEDPDTGEFLAFTNLSDALEYANNKAAAKGFKDYDPSWISWVGDKNDTLTFIYDNFTTAEHADLLEVRRENLANAYEEPGDVPFDQVSLYNLDNAGIEYGLNFRDPTGELLNRVFNGTKQYETRTYTEKRGNGKIPGAYLNKPMGIVQTGAGRAKYVGNWELGDPELRDYEWLSDPENARLLGNDGTEFQAQPGDLKWVYPIEWAERIDPREVTSRGIRARRITPENLVAPAEIAQGEANDTKFSLEVTDPNTLKFLNDQIDRGEVTRTYKTFLEIVNDDGTIDLYPPMASMQKDETGKKKMAHAMHINVWEESTGNPNSKNIVPDVYDKGPNKGQQKVDEYGNKKWKYVLQKEDSALSDVPAAYDPYQHSSNVVLNDQFESAWKRPRLVTYECIIPNSELTSEYWYGVTDPDKARRADGEVITAALPVGKHEWHKGVIAGNLKNTDRQVYMTRWLMPVRRMDNSEVARMYKEILDAEDEQISVPFNVVAPGLQEELEKIGVPIDYEGTAGYKSLRNRYGEEKYPRGQRIAEEASTRFSLDIDSDGNKLSERQQEYFADSKIRDDDGNLLVVYHGTEADFTTFDMTKGRSTMDIQGSFFSPWELDASGYGSKVGAYYLNIKNPAPESVGYKALRMFQGQNEAGIKARKYLESLGYDGVNNGNEEFIAFYPEQIKLTSNKNPTNNPDTRFSLDIYSTETYDAAGNNITIDDYNPTVTQSDLSENLYYSADGNTAYYKLPTGETVVLNNVGTDSPEAQYIKSLEAQNNANNTNTPTVQPYTIPPANRNADNGYRYGEQNDSLRRGTQEVPAPDQERTLRSAGSYGERNEARGSQSSQPESLKNLYSLMFGEEKKNIKGDPTRTLYNHKGEKITTEDVYPLESFERFLFKAAASGDYSSIEDAINKYLDKTGGFSEEEIDLFERMIDINNAYTDEQREAWHRALDEAVAKYGIMKPKKGDKNPNVVIPKKTDDGQKTRGHVRNVAANADSEILTERLQRERMMDALLGYTPLSNAKSLDAAERIIEREGGLDGAMAYFEAIVRSEKVPTAADIALGDLLISEFAKDPLSIDKAAKLVTEMSIMGTNLGQAVQAMAIIKKMTAKGQLYYLEGVVRHLNKVYEKRINDPKNKMKEIRISDALKMQLLTASTEKQINDAVEAIKDDLAKQIPPTWVDKWNAWRYLAMLGNPRTHIRNMVGNGAFMPAVFIKDMVARELEKNTNWIDSSARTKVTGRTAAEKEAFRKYAQEDYKVMVDILKGKEKGNKFVDANDIVSRRQIFDTKFLDELEKYNGNKLEGEDLWFMERYYVRTLAEALQAKGVKMEDLKDSKFTKSAKGKKILNEARAWAVREAQRDTYHDANAFAATLNQLKSKNVVANVLLEGLVPFTKTPLNIMKRAIEYSPIGLISSAIDLKRELRSGNKNTAEILDRMAAGLTGTGIMILGAFLSAIGLLRGIGPDEDKEDEFEKLQGHQNWSIEFPFFGNKKASYTIDWMAPMALPLFVGGTFWDLLNGEVTLESAWDIGKALSTLADPMLAMSMLDGLESTLSSIASANDASSLSMLLTSMATSYIAQGMPTLFGQFARTFDDTRRSTYVDKNSSVPSGLQRFLQTSILGKIPLVESTKMAYVDEWGRTDTQDNILLRALENFVSPGYANFINETPVDAELGRLAEAIGGKEGLKVLPSRASKSIGSQNQGKDEEGNPIKIDDKDLTADEYEKYAKITGQASYQLLADMFATQEYQEATDSEKYDMVLDAFDYADSLAKREIIPERNMDSSWMNTAEKFGPADFIVIRQNYEDNKANERIYNWIASDPRLSAEQVSILLTDKMSIPNYVDSTEDGIYKFQLNNSDDAPIESLYQAMCDEGLPKLYASKEYIEADGDGKAALMQQFATDTKAAALAQYSTTMSELDHKRVLKNASTVGKEAFNRVLDVSDDPTAQADWIWQYYSPDKMISNPDHPGYAFELDQVQRGSTGWLVDSGKAMWEERYNQLINSDKFKQNKNNRDYLNDMIEGEFYKFQSELEDEYARQLANSGAAETFKAKPTGYKTAEAFDIAYEQFGNDPDAIAMYVAQTQSMSTALKNPNRPGYFIVLPTEDQTRGREYFDSMFAEDLSRNWSYIMAQPAEKRGTAVKDMMDQTAKHYVEQYGDMLDKEGYDAQEIRLTGNTDEFNQLMANENFSKQQAIDLIVEKYAMNQDSENWEAKDFKINTYRTYVEQNYDKFIVNGTPEEFEKLRSSYKRDRGAAWVANEAVKALYGVSKQGDIPLLEHNYSSISDVSPRAYTPSTSSSAGNSNTSTSTASQFVIPPAESTSKSGGVTNKMQDTTKYRRFW